MKIEPQIADLDFEVEWPCSFGRQPEGSALPSNPCTAPATTVLTLRCPSEPTLHTTVRPLCRRHEAQLRIAIATVAARARQETGGTAGEACAAHWAQEKTFVPLITTWTVL